MPPLPPGVSTPQRPFRVNSLLRRFGCRQSPRGCLVGWSSRTRGTFGARRCGRSSRSADRDLPSKTAELEAVLADVVTSLAPGMLGSSSRLACLRVGAGFSLALAAPPAFAEAQGESEPPPGSGSAVESAPPAGPAPNEIVPPRLVGEAIATYPEGASGDAVLPGAGAAVLALR